MQQAVETYILQVRELQNLAPHFILPTTQERGIIPISQNGEQFGKAELPDDKLGK